MMNTGRKAIKYEGRLPDGRIIQKRSFNVNEPVALMGCFQVRGRGPWHAAGVFAKSVSPEAEAERSYSGLIFVEARRVEK
jgi:hypothetical protein